MSARVGIELGPTLMRAVRIGGWRGGAAGRATVERAWDPSRPEALVAALRAEWGDVASIGVAVGLGFLHVKQVSLPPASDAVRRRMLAVEPDRFFPVTGGEVVVALAPGSDVAFALERATLGRWITALEEWAPVESVEGSPTALARTLGAVSGTYATEAADGERGIVELAAGRVARARRMAAPDDSAARASARTADPFAAALGAARAIDAPAEALLLTPELEATLRARRRQRTLAASLACVAAAGFALWAADASRERHLERLDRAVAAAEATAGPALAVQARLAAARAEEDALRAAMAVHPGHLKVLAALTEVLPEHATVLTLRARGDEWVVEGRAADAAALVPALDGDSRFTNVRLTTASARFREGRRTWESFSIAFRTARGT